MDANDLGQVLDGLRVHLENWERTLAYHEGESNVDGLVEECTDEHEAREMVEWYGRLTTRIGDALREG